VSERTAEKTISTAAGARIVGILLAAGRSERFGSDKLLAPLPHSVDDVQAGTPVAVAACLHLVAALPYTIAVIRSGAVQLEASLRDAGAHIATCVTADEGMSATLACGIAAAADVDADGWVIALGDMPWLRADTIRGVADALLRGALLAAPFHRGARGHPVGFGRSLRGGLLALTGDEGARDIVRAHEADLVRLDVDDPGSLRDVDTPGDLAMGSHASLQP
jgi:molybdenum cofactor cytidylyltransferase